MQQISNQEIVGLLKLWDDFREMAVQRQQYEVASAFRECKDKLITPTEFRKAIDAIPKAAWLRSIDDN